MFGKGAVDGCGMGGKVKWMHQTVIRFLTNTKSIAQHLAMYGKDFSSVYAIQLHGVPLLRLWYHSFRTPQMMGLTP